MKNKLLRILAIVFVLAAICLAVAACKTNEQSLDGMYIVTFKLNGGSLDTGSTIILDEIFQGYPLDGPRKAADLREFEGNKLSYDGYVFEYWCTDKALTQRYDFKQELTGDLTLYAKWRTAIVYRYTIQLVDGDNLVDLGSYTVAQGAAFNDVNGYGKALATKNKTFLGYYIDKGLTTEWDSSFTHPGGEQSRDIPVYVKAMDGVWSFVSNYDELKSAVSKGANIWLTADIDCRGEELYFADSSRNYNSMINGNHYTISNFVIPSKGTVMRREFTLFGTLGEQVSIVDVNFTDAKLSIVKGTQETKVAALAITAKEGATIRNVSISGAYTNSNSVVLDRINQAFYDEATIVVPDSFTANIVAADN